MRSMFDRRRFLGLAGAGVGALALGACGGPSIGGGAGGGTAPVDVNGPDFSGVEAAKSITFWSNHPGGSEQITRSLLDAFTQESGIEVELVTAGANYEEIAQRFQTAQASGDLPDAVVLSDVWWFRYYMQQTIIPLGTAIEAAGITTAGYRESLIGDYQYDGGQWALPWARSTPLFYYNKAHWEAAGLEDRAPQTWAEFAEWAPALKEATGVSAYEFPALDGYAGWILQNLLWGYGSGWSAEESFDIICDNPQAVEAITFAQNSIKDGWATVASQAAVDDLAAEGCSATIESTGSLVGLLDTVGDKFEVGVGFLPGGPQVQTPVCPTGGAGLGIPSGIDPANQLASAMMIGFLTNPENTVKFSAATGYMPVQTDADVSTLLAETPQIQTAIDQLEVTRSQDWARVFVPGAELEMANAAAAVLNEQADVQETLTGLKSTLEELYTTQVEPNIG
ncbi:ABC transporter substrate-binding protein [Naumannella halotolerans]|uniref:sn-glycerol 3-phosphate transport system substrate-binding protein n=1 Tax=Naumannella halotolerans TaxID=993414 RepID=A0A4R7JAF9_9ACTN|nr:ABC transporter substrate-binding protein [Naumannella halotolerans]TDT33617.1 sn-glycerol 3-phosphate transport system substrate-binding protein [Naumannella halotolerans]